jgi:hypothetical protein
MPLIVPYNTYMHDAGQSHSCCSKGGPVMATLDFPVFTTAHVDINDDS